MTEVLVPVHVRVGRGRMTARPFNGYPMIERISAASPGRSDSEARARGPAARAAALNCVAGLAGPRRRRPPPPPQSRELAVHNHPGPGLLAGPRRRIMRRRRRPAAHGAASHGRRRA
jgi:hypothetical protein